jgi:hypothetical protein
MPSVFSRNASASIRDCARGSLVSAIVKKSAVESYDIVKSVDDAPAGQLPSLRQYPTGPAKK